MITIQLPDHIERSIRAAVQDGRFTSLDDAVTAAWRAFAEPLNASPISLDDLHRQMIADGLLAGLPDPTQDVDDDDEPTLIDGEPLSVTILPDRR